MMRRKLITRSLGVLELLVGIGAVIGGGRWRPLRVGCYWECPSICSMAPLFTPI